MPGDGVPTCVPTYTYFKRNQTIYYVKIDFLLLISAKFF